jgi:hypothetical protein
MNYTQCKGCSILNEHFNVCDTIREQNLKCVCSVCLVKSICDEDCEEFTNTKKMIDSKSSNIELAFQTHIERKY